MRRKAHAALLSLALAALLPARPALADDAKPTAAASDEASRRFKSGVAFYKDKDFTAALVEFKRAYELVPNYIVLYNLGQTARELRDHAAALDAFERYLHDGGAKISAARRKEVSAAIDDLRRKVGKLKIAISVDGAEVTVDDVPVGVSPLASPVVLNVGRHKLSATSSGHTPAQRVVDIASMEEQTVTLALTPLETTSSKIEPPPPPPKRGPHVAAWVMLGTTGAFAVAAAVTGGLAVSAHGDLESALATYPGDAKAISSAQDRTRTFAITTDVLGGIAVAGAITTALLFTIGPRAPEKANTAFSVSPAGLAFRAAF